MWIFTKQGFYSVVQDFRDPSLLLVRARSRADLERLSEGLHGRPEILATPDADYPYRLVAQREDFASWLASSAAAADYTNFKAAVAQSAGLERALLYEEVWSDMRRLELLEDRERKLEPDPRPAGRRRGEKP